MMVGPLPCLQTGLDQSRHPPAAQNTSAKNRCTKCLSHHHGILHSTAAAPRPHFTANEAPLRARAHGFPGLIRGPSSPSNNERLLLSVFGFCSLGIHRFLLFVVVVLIICLHFPGTWIILSSNSEGVTFPFHICVRLASLPRSHGLIPPAHSEVVLLIMSLCSCFFGGKASHGPH